REEVEMPDEKLPKLALDAQIILEKQHYLEAIEETSRATRPLAEALRALEENSAVRQMSIEQQEVLTRAALGPLHAGIFDIGSTLQREMERERQTIAAVGRAGVIPDIRSTLQREMRRIGQATAGFEARFRLPEMSETGRLIAELQAGAFSEVLTKYAEIGSSLRRAMDSMRMPWLDTQEVM